jgi:beta-phosphoglucomutase family hydrolase
VRLVTVAAPPRTARAIDVTALDLTRFDAVLFDLDGVLTDTASLHAEAWKRMFDEFLMRWSEEHGHPFVPFQIDPDYLQFVDGKPRFEGVASFLESRRIVLPEGDATDPPDADTIHGLGNRKNELVLRLIEKEGVTPFDGSVAFVKHVRDSGLRTAVVSSSKNAGPVLAAAEIADLFDDRVDGLVAEDLGLPGKPSPDTFLEAARRLDTTAARSIVVEDAVVGVEAGRLGGFGYVIGVDREGDPDRLMAHGADVVVDDLAELVSG